MTLRKYYATGSHHKSYSSVFSCRFLSVSVGKANAKHFAFKILFYNPWDILSLTSKVFLTDNFQNYLICEKYHFFQIVLGVSCEPDSLTLMLTWKRSLFQSNSVTEKHDKIKSPLKDRFRQSKTGFPIFHYKKLYQSKTGNRIRSLHTYNYFPVMCSF